MWAYSPGASGARVILILDSDLPDTSEADRILRRDLTRRSRRPGRRRQPPVRGRDWTLNPGSPLASGRSRITGAPHPFWVTLGDAYWQSGDERYARGFVEQMMHWVRTQPVPTEGFTNREAAWRTIETGRRPPARHPAGRKLDGFVPLLPVVAVVRRR
jgi:hypothetical protein